MTAIALQHKEEIIQRMSKGEPLTSIAQSLGYANHAGIWARLGDDPDYQAALRAGMVSKLEHREEQLEVAADNVSVTRADRLLGHARWWAERLDPGRFGVKSEVTMHGGPMIVNVIKFGQDQVEKDCTPPDNDQVISTG